jgi:hypothetical protein
MTIEARAVERAFPLYPLGVLEAEMLANFRVGLRELPNPNTGLPFTEREIATTTARLSRYWREAKGLDLALQGGQQRALYLADQVRIDRSSSLFLQSHHGPTWGEAPLPAVGGSGLVEAEAAPGTIFVGSTTIPDPTAAQATRNGLTYQVLFNVETPGSGMAELTLKGISTGTETNLAPGDVLQWSANKPGGAQATCTVTQQFRGGVAKESAGQFAKRLLARIAHKPAAGNDAQFRAWARQASVAVEDAFVYSCALQAGTTVVAITQKRSGVSGPDGRIPSIGTLTDVTLYLVPPRSPVVPANPLVIIVPPTKEPADLEIGLSLPLGQASGWADFSPWPTDVCTVSAVTSPTEFKVQTFSQPPADVPALVSWVESLSRFERLQVQSVVLDSFPFYDVVLTSAPASPIVEDQAISPALFTDARQLLLAETIEAYFDSLGPGEVVDLISDTRAHRAYRFPEPNEEYPQRAGAGIIAWLQDAFGAALADSTAEGGGTPTVPADPSLGPAMMVPGGIFTYALT